MMGGATAQKGNDEATRHDDVSRGEPDEARRRLAAIYGWFREGFETRDLRAAKILLAELGAP
jgi:hypothetical protein